MVVATSVFMGNASYVKCLVCLDILDAIESAKLGKERYAKVKD
jgi:hypothetical protein